ncbi:MAG: energy-coupling factor transporter transmembrane protein EcfT [Desulfurococcales archaeon]|nr:energy-coupling factor transporter transmembrane protein EcfT [Desulfurococcales archaeon]
MNNMLESFIRNLSRLIDSFNRTNRDVRGKVYIFPLSILLTLLVSTTDNPISLVTAATFTLLVSLHARDRAGMIVRTAWYLALLSMIIGLPLLITRTNSIMDFGQLLRSIEALKVTENSIETYARFIIRIILAPLPVLATIYYLGWPSIASRAYRLPLLRLPAAITTIFIIHLPRLLRHALSMIMAREARTFHHDIKTAWKNRVSIIGDLIVGSATHSKILQYAIDARTFNDYPFDFEARK